MSHAHYTRIARAIAFLREHAASQPSLPAVAAHVGLSPHHFQREFTAWAGVSPKKFLQVLTLERAKRKLARHSVLETALDVGLSGPGRLHDLFVTLEAMSPGEYKRRGADITVEYGFHDTPFGPCLLATTPRGVCHLAFVAPGAEEPTVRALRTRWARSTVLEAPAAGAAIVARLFIQDQHTQPTTAPHPSFRVFVRGTAFQTQVWRALLAIPSGDVLSYGDLASQLGRAKAARAVGTAVGQNAVGYLIPCHRVLRADGGLGRYRWGQTRKHAMLAREAALYGDAP